MKEELQKLLLPTQDKEPCKCCGEQSDLYGVLDFSNNCNERRGFYLPLTGVPIYYHQCSKCQFIFTTAFDNFSKQDMLKWIYCDDYILVDPNYKENKRPFRNATMVYKLFPDVGSDFSILDYGGGVGYFAKHLKAYGFNNVTTYDPFVEANATKPDSQFDLITCFEVFEHHPDPLGLVQDIKRYLKPKGMIFFSTVLHTEYTAVVRVQWWYIAPRNGHISIFSDNSLRLTLQKVGLKLDSAGPVYHFGYEEPPEFLPEKNIIN